jgi:hypothetical protein
MISLRGLFDLSAFRRARRTSPIDQRLVLVGHSHLGVVVQAARSSGQPVHAAGTHVLWEETQDEAGVARIQAEVLDHAAPADPVFSMRGGGYQLTIGLLQHSRPFDFWAPGEAVDDAVELLPVDAVKGVLAHYARNHLRTLEVMAERLPNRLYHMQCPPPISDNRRIVESITAIPGNEDFAGDVGRVQSASQRLKTWRLYCAMIADHCARIGATFVPCPPEAIAEDGFLHPRFYGDPVHANEDYGLLVLRQIQDLAQRRRRRGGAGRAILAGLSR